MFKIFFQDNNQEFEILPKDGIYTVLESGLYSFCWKGDTSLLEDRGQFVTYESETIEEDLDIIEGGISVKCANIFRNTFGYTKLKIGNDNFYFNVLLKKQKANLVESIFIGLWKNNSEVFDIFYKSRGFIDGSSDSNLLGQTTKYLDFVDVFCSKMKELYPLFRTNSQTVIRTERVLKDFSLENLSPSSAEWILHNIDLGIPVINGSIENSFNIAGVDVIFPKIESDRLYESFSIYENQIILGSIQKMYLKLLKLQHEILSNIQLPDYEEDVVDFRYLRKLPFIELLNRTKYYIRIITKIQKSYQILFINTSPKLERPRLTKIFSTKRHYQIVYKLILKAWSLNWNLSGEFLVFNIKKLSELYELYNLHLFINELDSLFPKESKEIQYLDPNNSVYITKVSYCTKKIIVNLYYEPFISSKPQDIDLIRIDTRKGDFYRPDYILEIVRKDQKQYYIFDSKYSDLKSIRKYYLDTTIFKYILNIGIYDRINEKVNSLCLLYPGSETYNHIETSIFSPSIAVVGVSPRSESKFREMLRSLFYEEFQKLPVLDIDSLEEYKIESNIISEGIQEKNTLIPLSSKNIDLPTQILEKLENCTPPDIPKCLNEISSQLIDVSKTPEFWAIIQLLLQEKPEIVLTTMVALFEKLGNLNIAYYPIPPSMSNLCCSLLKLPTKRGKVIELFARLELRPQVTSLDKLPMKDILKTARTPKDVLQIFEVLDVNDTQLQIRLLGSLPSLCAQFILVGLIAEKATFKDVEYLYNEYSTTKESLIFNVIAVWMSLFFNVDNYKIRHKKRLNKLQLIKRIHQFGYTDFCTQMSEEVGLITKSLIKKLSEIKGEYHPIKNRKELLHHFSVNIFEIPVRCYIPKKYLQADIEDLSHAFIAYTNLQNKYMILSSDNHQEISQEELFFLKKDDVINIKCIHADYADNTYTFKACQYEFLNITVECGNISPKQQSVYKGIVTRVYDEVSYSVSLY